MRSLDFRPSIAARILSGAKSNQIALIYDNHSPYYMFQIQTGCWDYCRANGIRLLAQPVDVADPQVGEQVRGELLHELLEDRRVPTEAVRLRAATRGLPLEDLGAALAPALALLNKHFQELDAAKSNLIGGFALLIDSNRKLLGYMAVIGFYRLPLDWLDSYPKQVEAVSLAAVREAWQRRIVPAALQGVRVGQMAGGKPPQ